MRVLEIITESKNSDQLDELDMAKVGRGVGKVARGVATGVGAVAGGVVGAGKAFMKGFRGGKAFVGGDPEDKAAKKSTQPAAGKTAATTAGTGSATKAAPAQSSTGTAPATPTTTAQPAATTTTPGAAPAAANKVSMKAIKGALKTLPKNQRTAIRKLAAARAGTV
jgi:hypothetical protein